MERLRGIVAPGAGSGSGSHGGPWTLAFSLHPHRSIAGDLDDGTVTIWRASAPGEDLALARAAFPEEGDLVDVEVTRPERISGLAFRLRGETEYVFVSWSPAEDVELVARARALAPPASVEDAVLGAFAFDPRLRWYGGTIAFGPTTQVRLAITPQNERDPQPSIERAREFVAWVEGAASALRDEVVRALFPTWDDAWRTPDDDGVGREEFAARLTITSITWDDGESPENATVWFDDDSLFGGHTVEVTLQDRRVVCIDF